MARDTMISFEQIRIQLAAVPAQSTDSDQLTPTAVALILRKAPDGLELLFIERATDERDPWSGNIGFPGGRRSRNDLDLQQTAERETSEEVGLDLGRSAMLGRLSDIEGANLPVRVACFVYAVETDGPITLNPEVSDAFWVSLSDLTDPDRQLTAMVNFAGKAVQSQAIRLPQQNKPVLWGITYRLVRQFIEIVT
jgi:8-oxo-dGTP pyrophosphatase MutT (NUDIX family)